MVEGKSVGAHRVAFLLQSGDWPTQTVHHTCFNRLCMNGAHLKDVSFDYNRRTRNPDNIVGGK